MIDEPRMEFDSWVIDTYNELHDILFDENRKFKMKLLLSGYMFCYILIKPYYLRVRNCEDVRQDIDPNKVADIRAFLEWPNLDNQMALFSLYFIPEESRDLDDVDMEVLTPILAYGAVERGYAMKAQGKPQTLEQLIEWGEDWTHWEDAVYYTMDFLERLEREGREVPEQLRIVAKMLRVEN